jgi:hypothetical protein
MASVKENILDIDKALNLLKTYKEQIIKNQLKSSQAASSMGGVTNTSTTENN